MTADERTTLRRAIDSAKRANPFFRVIPLEQDLLERCEDLDRKLRRTREKCRRLESGRDRWRERALRAEKSERLLRAGVEVLTR